MKRLIINIVSWVGLKGEKQSSEKNLSYYESRKEYRKRLELRLKTRVEKDILRGDIYQAISRFEGFFQLFPLNQDLHCQVAKLYLQVGDYKRAGKHFYFQSSLNDEEQKCVDAFIKSCGNDSVIILKRTVRKCNFKVSESDIEVKKKLKILMEDVVSNRGEIPNFLDGLKRHLDKGIRNGEI